MGQVAIWLQETLGLSSAFQGKLISTFVALFILWLARRIVLKLVFSKYENPKIRYHWRNSVTYTIYVLGILFIGRIWFEGFESVSTYLGLLSAGLAIALKDLLSNLAGFLFIMFRRPFEVGDRIQIGEYSGDVIDIRLFQFTIMEIGNWVDADQSTGRIIHIPNGKIFLEAQANYSKGFKYIWNEIPVLLTFESDWKKSKKILQAIADKDADELNAVAQRKLKQVSEKFMIFYSNLTPTVYTSVKDSGVLLTIRYLTEPKDRRASEEKFWEDILTDFGKCDDIDFAYPTMRHYDNISEGKSPAKVKDDGDFEDKEVSD